MNFHSAAKGLRTSFRQSDVADLAFLNQFRHRANGLFDWRVTIDAMLVVKIDRLNSQPPQAALDRPAHVIRFAIHTAPGRIIGVADDTVLGGDDNLLAASTNGFADQFFVSEWSVHVSCVEKINAEFYRAMDRRYRFLV